jgi:hypothetical protein
MKISSSIVHKLSVTLTAAIAVFATSTAADATGVGAWVGAALSQPGCFYDQGGWGQATNYPALTTCANPESLYWEIPLPANSGTYNPVIYAASGIECAITVCPQSGNVGGCTVSSWVYTSGGITQPANGTSGLTVPSNGYMYANCLVPTNTSVDNVNY